MSQFFKVKGKPNLVRDSYSKSIINNDTNAFAKAKALKEKINRKNKQIEDLDERVARLEEILKDILKDK